MAPIFEWVITFTNNGLKRIADLPFSGITSIWLNQWQLLILSLSLSLLVFALVNYKKKLLLSSICLIIIFQGYSTYSKISAVQQSRILFFSLRKNYATAFIDSDKAILLTDLNPVNKNYQFFVKHALDKMQVKDILFIKWKQDTLVNSFIKKNHQIIFHNYKILLLDEVFNYKKIAGLPTFNSVLLHQNPKKSVSTLRNEVVFSTLLIDGTNKDYKIKMYEEDSSKFRIHHYTLKKNKAYLINLK